MEKLRQEDLYHSDKKFYFRFSYPVYNVEVWSDDSVTFAGKIVFHSRQSEKKKGNKYVPHFQLVQKSEYLAPVDVQTVLSLISEYNILSIPTDDSVNGWTYTDGKKMHVIRDGVQYSLEYSTRFLYEYKEYNNPDFYPTLKEAIAVEMFQNKLETALKLHDNFYAFIRELPLGTYLTSSMSWMTTHEKTRYK